MTRQFIAGGMYGDHLPTGTWVVLVPKSHVQTSMGRFELPPGETFGPLFVRCTDVDGFRFAGQAHDTLTPAAWEATVWPITATPWKALAPPCCGVSPVIYDQFGLLHTSDCGQGLGSQGYRYVAETNQIISGDATYRIDLGGGRFLFEYTNLGGLLIGQAAYDGGGVQVWDGSTLRQLEPGDCRFIRAARAGDVVALAFTRPDGVVLISTTLAELRALPIAVSPAPPVPRPPNPTPEPSPMLQAPNELFAVQSAIASHPEINTRDEIARGTILDYVCADLGGTPWGRKSRNRQGTDLNTDALTYLRTDGQFEIYDVISGGDGSATWDLGVSPTNPTGIWAPGENGYWAPGRPVTTPTDPPDPPDQPPADDLARRVTVLEFQRAEQQGQIAGLQADVAALAARLDALPPTTTMDPAALSVVVQAVLASYEVTGRSAQTFGHSHSVKLGLQRKP